MPAILGTKLGMTRVFTDDGSQVPVTVVEALPNVVTAIRRAERDGYDAVQLAGVPTSERKLTKGELGHLAKAGADPMKKVVEFRDAEFPAPQGGSPEASSASSESPTNASQAAAPGGEAEEAADDASAAVLMVPRSATWFPSPSSSPATR